MGKPDELKGHVPFALIRVASDEEADDVSEDVLLKEINLRVREGECNRPESSYTRLMMSIQTSVPSQLLMD